MQLADLIARSEHAILMIGNLFVVFVATDAYRKAGTKDRGLFLLAISAALGVFISFLHFTLTYMSQTYTMEYATWQIVSCLNSLSMVVWAWATYTIVTRYTKMLKSEK
jgi:hypothetical protein